MDQAGGLNMKDLSLGLLQIDSRPGDGAANLAKIVGRAQAAAGRGANLIVAPELALSGFMFSREDYWRAAQTIPGPAIEEVGAQARRSNTYIVFGLPERSGRDLFNSLAVVGPRGEMVAVYRKLNLWVNEKRFFRPGDELGLFETEFGRVGAAICYDFVFPELVRALAVQGAGLVIHATAWLSTEEIDAFGKDLEHYLAIVRVRAWENQIYLASCNRCGRDENQYYFANSAVAAPWGALVGRLGESEGTLVVRTEWDRLADWRQFAPYWEDLRLDVYRKYLDPQGNPKQGGEA